MKFYKNSIILLQEKIDIFHRTGTGSELPIQVATLIIIYSQVPKKKIKPV